MVNTTRTFEFEFDKDKTCKTKWTIDMFYGPDGPMIADVRIEAGRKPDGKEMGCAGHPGTIRALARGRGPEQIDTDALCRVACGRACSCGQAFAECLRRIRESGG